jgi:flagella basal body P-ring formation protein FlgA
VRNVFATLDEAIGKEVTRPIAAQQPVGAASVRAPIYVARGSAVTVFVRSGQVMLTTSARADEAGSLGEMISCQSILDRKKKFFAKVVGPDQVLVFPGGISAGN